jgi:SAM-dependent methyltransferase
MKNKNPWLDIPSEDYEHHMSAPNVGQLQMLDEIFENVLNEFSPGSVAVLGCTAGNGFQHLVNREFERVVGIDINFKYLAECRAWYVQDVQNLQLVCGDLNEIELDDSIFNLVHAALIFEYVESDRLLEKVFHWLKPGGILSIVLQLSNEKVEPVSDTPYQSLKQLSNFMHLADVNDFKERAFAIGFTEGKEPEIKSLSGKNFIEMYLKK